MAPITAAANRVLNFISALLIELNTSVVSLIVKSRPGLDSFLVESLWNSSFLDQGEGRSRQSVIVTETQFKLRPLRSNSTLIDMFKHTILCVDDEIDNVDALERLFR